MAGAKKRADDRYSRSFRLPDGTRKYVYGKTRVEADQKLREAQHQAERGELVAASHQKLAEYLDYWMSVKRLTIEPTTEAQYRSRIRAHIVPALGKYPLQKLSQSHIQRFVSTLVDEGLAPGTVRLHYQTLQTALSDAVEWKLIAFHPCGKGIKLPRDEEVETMALILYVILSLRSSPTSRAQTIVPCGLGRVEIDPFRSAPGRQHRQAAHHACERALTRLPTRPG